MAQRRLRSGPSAGDANGCASLSGAEWTPGMWKSRNSDTMSPPTKVTSRSLVPGPSASNGSSECHLCPVTALPRRITSTPAGVAIRVVVEGDTRHACADRVLIAGVLAALGGSRSLGEAFGFVGALGSGH